MDILPRCACLALLCFLAGCSTNNRNIVFIESSGIAVIVSYNPQTELPEGKVGYFRGMFAIIPTGLNTEPGGTGGSAHDVPTVIVKQRVLGGFVSGVDIDNRFLVGAPDTGQAAAAQSLFGTGTGPFGQ